MFSLCKTNLKTNIYQNIKTKIMFNDTNLCLKEPEYSSNVHKTSSLTATCYLPGVKL